MCIKMLSVVVSKIIIIIMFVVSKKRVYLENNWIELDSSDCQTGA